MASHQDLSHKADEIVGQAQVKRDEMMNQPTTQDQSSPAQTATDLKDQAASFLQQVIFLYCYCYLISKMNELK